MTIIIAHRGFADNCRENTLEAYQKAIDLSADAIELDVRKTKDNVFISFHDEVISEKQVSQLTYTEINDLAGNLNFHVPTLEEVLKLVRGKIKLDIELKEKGYEIEIIDLVLEYLIPEEFIMTSFKFKSLLNTKINFPQIKTGLIIDNNTATNLNIINHLSILDCFALHLNLINSSWFKIGQENKKDIFIWTVNEPKNIEQILKNKAITGLITDNLVFSLNFKKKLTFLA